MKKKLRSFSCPPGASLRPLCQTLCYRLKTRKLKNLQTHVGSSIGSGGSQAHAYGMCQKPTSYTTYTSFLP